MLLTTPVQAQGRRPSDSVASSPVLPAQRPPSPLECVPEPTDEPTLRRSRVRAVLERAPFDPQSARIILVGLLLFGALVSELSQPPPQPADPGPSASEHGPAEPGRH